MSSAFSTPLPQSHSAAIDWPLALSQHGSWMRKVVQSRLGHLNDVDDVVQEIATAVLEQESRPTNPQKVAPWLYGVAVRQASQFLRKQGRQERLRENYSRELADMEAPPNPRDWVIHAERRLVLAKALDALEPAAREVLLLKYSEGLSYRELAALYEVTEKSLEHRLLKARQCLRRELQAMDA